MSENKDYKSLVKSNFKAVAKNRSLLVKQPEVSSGINGVHLLLCAIVGIALFLLLFSTLTGVGSGWISFEGFLEKLDNSNNIPQIPTSWLINIGSGITDDWGLFNWFKSFINFIWKPISLALYVSIGVLNLVPLIFWFLSNFVYA